MLKLYSYYVGGDIFDWQFSASTTATKQSRCRSHYGRLYAKGHRSWCPSVAKYGEWLQIDMGAPAKVTGVAVQGACDRKRWTTSYFMQYSNDTVSFLYAMSRHVPFSSRDYSEKVRLAQYRSI